MKSLILLIALLSGCSTPKYFHKDGKEFLYFPDGTIDSETNWKNGKFEGLQKSYRKDGTLHLEYEMKASQFHGFLREYDEKERLISEYFYIDGERNGVFKDWYSNGQVRRISIFKMGVLLERSMEFTENGEPFYSVEEP